MKSFISTKYYNRAWRYPIRSQDFKQLQEYIKNPVPRPDYLRVASTLDQDGIVRPITTNSISELNDSTIDQLELPDLDTFSEFANNSGGYLKGAKKQQHLLQQLGIDEEDAIKATQEVRKVSNINFPSDMSRHEFFQLQRIAGSYFDRWKSINGKRRRKIAFSRLILDKKRNRGEFDLVTDTSTNDYLGLYNDEDKAFIKPQHTDTLQQLSISNDFLSNSYQSITNVLLNLETLISYISCHQIETDDALHAPDRIQHISTLKPYHQLSSLAPSSIYLGSFLHQLPH
jgi:hypothetical protein